MVKLVGRAKRDNRSSVEHERLLSLINSMADGVIAVNQDLAVVLSNGAAQNILDVNTSLQNKVLSSILQPYDKNNQPVSITNIVREVTTQYSSRDLHLHYADGSDAALYLSIAPVHLGFGERGLRGFVILLRDITREKSLEDERDEFISVVSHELRTPVTIAEGDLSNAMFIVDKTKDISKVKAALSEAHDQTIYLSGMINDLSTLSRAERGKLNMNVTKIDVHSFMMSLGSSYDLQAKAKKLKLVVSIEPDAKVLMSSELYVREILQNFVTNALKYTEKGVVTIHASSIDKGIRFDITDTGIGISKADQEKVFDKFFRSEDFRTRKTNGTGLGLYVVLKLSHILHAEITLKSRLNVGSVFSIRIPNLDVPNPEASEGAE